MKNLFPPFTTVLLTICVALALVSNFGQNRDLILPLLLTLVPDGGLPEIRHGQVWRLVTPIFLHFGQLHIIFNGAAFWSVGGALEQRRGAFELGWLTLLLALISNLAEYAWSGHGFFGGLSGVLFGLLGYIWVQGRSNPRFGLALPNPVVGMLLLWFALCWVGIIPNVANMAHTGGLVAGVAVGYLVARLERTGR